MKLKNLPILYEKKGERLLPLPRFLGRLGFSLLLAFGLTSVALIVGTFGYHFVAGLPWMDAELNAVMILTGMGPVDPMKSLGSKVFASVYALLSGFVFLTSMGIVLSPLFHRIVHRFHLDEGDSSRDSAPPGRPTPRDK